VEGECRLQTPHHVTVNGFEADKAFFLATACFDYGDGQVHRAQGRARLKWQAAFISAHLFSVDEAGAGNVRKL
jgi:hypothetical protein